MAQLNRKKDSMFTRHFAIILAWPVIAAIAVITGLVVGAGSAGWLVGLITGIVILVGGYIILAILMALNFRSGLKNPDKAFSDIDKLLK